MKSFYYINKYTTMPHGQKQQWMGMSSQLFIMSEKIAMLRLLSCLANITLIMQIKNTSTYTILSGSSAHCPTAFVTLTSSAWLVPVNRLTRCGMPPDFRICARFGCALASSPKAPTTFTNTWKVKKKKSPSVSNIFNIKCTFLLKWAKTVICILILW